MEILHTVAELQSGGKKAVVSPGEIVDIHVPQLDGHLDAYSPKSKTFGGRLKRDNEGISISVPPFADARVPTITYKKKIESFTNDWLSYEETEPKMEPPPIQKRYHAICPRIIAFSDNN